ncbi:AhpC/TSA family protein [Butyricimonas virosa]|uniref:AhpC/TSA family protein n=1 Tax=Butyricimonas virosa TaxID=544645 RepID=A0A413IJ68_9BACT|nr:MULTISPECIES: TlpA disulfide reductase family protein [Butyricimonas]RGY13312.1 AhpC/TSA family protein [Butyricimonas virosa]
MKKIVLLIGMVLASFAFCRAQEGFKITAETSGVPDGKMLLISERNDTLATTNMVGGKFEFTGRVDRAMVAYIMTADMKARIPLMIENAVFNVIANEKMVYVDGGGKAQELYRQFDAINASVMQEQQRMQKEAQQAYQEQNMPKLQALQAQLQKFADKAQQQEADLLKANGGSFVAAFVITNTMRQVGLERLRERYNYLTDEIKSGPYGKVIAQQIALYESLEIGGTAPDFTAMTPEGDTLSLHQVKGKVKLLDFWASWCNPCRQENPNMLKLYQKYQSKGLEIISFSLDNDPRAWKKAIEEDGMVWKHFSDLKAQGSPIAAMYNLMSIPYTLLLDENNKIVGKNLRGAQLQKKVAELLK